MRDCRRIETVESGELCLLLRRVLASRVRSPIWRPRGFPARERESPHDVTAVAEVDLVGEARNLPWAKVQK